MYLMGPDGQFLDFYTQVRRRGDGVRGAATHLHARHCYHSYARTLAAHLVGLLISLTACATHTHTPATRRHHTQLLSAPEIAERMAATVARVEAEAGRNTGAGSGVLRWLGIGR